MKKSFISQVFLLAGLLAFLVTGSAMAGPITPGPDVPLRPDVAPVMSIPSQIAADPNSTVKVPVSFTGNSNSVSSVVFSIDYDNTWLQYDNSLPNPLTVSIPNGFVGTCTPNTADTFAEINCFVYDPTPPLDVMPDRVLVTVTLRTGNAPGGTIAPVNFSSTNPVSFGNTSGQAVAGSGVNGSVKIGTGEIDPTDNTIIFLPLVQKPIDPQVDPTCTTTTIANQTLEPQGGYWYFPPTVKTAWYTNYRYHSQYYSAYTGIDPWLQPGINLFSYSSIRTNNNVAFTIPATATSARLGFWQYSITNEPYYLAKDGTTLVGSEQKPLAPRPEVGKLLELDEYMPDVQYVLVLGPDDLIKASPVWELWNSPGWVYREIGLLNWKGQPIKIQFGTANDGAGGVSSMYIDDVILTVCTP
jgi:hypothetical protein